MAARDRDQPARRDVHGPRGAPASGAERGVPAQYRVDGGGAPRPGDERVLRREGGVEALSDCLRVEAAPLGVAVGVAYFLFLDTDMVRDGEARCRC